MKKDNQKQKENIIMIGDSFATNKAQVLKISETNTYHIRSAGKTKAEDHTCPRRSAHTFSKRWRRTKD